MSIWKFFSEPYFSNLIWINFNMMIFLSIFRLLSMEFFMMLSDGLGSLMIFFYFITRGRCMSIFIVLNGLIGIITAFQRTFIIYDYLSLQYSFLTSVLFFISIYSILVYGVEVILGSCGIYKYRWENFFSGFSRPNISENNNDSSNNNNFQQNNVVHNRSDPFAGRSFQVGS